MTLMHTREARRWMRAEPKVREGARYDATTGVIKHFYVPQLRGRDVAVIGLPLEYPTAEEAIRCAKQFQKDVRKNHPDAVE